MIKLKIHSIVDVITNSSTVIYTYQNSTKQAKELVAEMLKLAGIDKTPDDVFYYGVFNDEYRYEDDLPEGVDFDSFVRDAISGEIENPEWLDSDDEWGSTYLYLVPKDEKYSELANKIEKLVCSVSAEEGAG
jgi:hypothetical protein